MQELQFSATSRTVGTKSGLLHYHQAGEGPPLILLHGSGPGVTGWANFKDNFAFFARRFTTIILDLPGYGGSDQVAGNPISVSVVAVTELMDALGIDQAHLLGNSLGGNVAARVAAAHGNRVSRLCTIGGLGTMVLGPFPAEGINLLVEFAEQPSRAALIAWLRSMIYDPALLTDELIEERWKQAMDPKTLESTRKMYSRRAIEALKLRPPPIEHLAAITCPTLVTWGRDDRVMPLEMMLLPMRLIPHCEVHIFPNCGHWAMIERKEEFESVVDAFLLRETPPA